MTVNKWQDLGRTIPLTSANYNRTSAQHTNTRSAHSSNKQNMNLKHKHLFCLAYLEVK